MENKYNINLVCGCGHTGSTIFSRVIGEHSKIYFPNKETNTFLLYNDFKRILLLKDFEKECKKNNYEQILEKTNRHVWHIDYIRNNYKNTKFIIITRNAKDVISSLFKRESHKTKSNLIKSIIRYRDDSLWSLRQKNNKDCIFVRFEDFVDDPKKISTKVFKFMNLKYEKEVMNFDKKKINWNHQTLIKKTDGVGEKNHDLLRNWQINQKIFKKKTNWKKIIPEKYHYEINQFMKQYGNEIMKKFGY